MQTLEIFRLEEKPVANIWLLHVSLKFKNTGSYLNKDCTAENGGVASVFAVRQNVSCIVIRKHPPALFLLTGAPLKLRATHESIADIPMNALQPSPLLPQFSRQVGGIVAVRGSAG